MVTRTRAAWTRRYMPFAFTALGLFIMVTIVPSVLNVHQSNPTQTLEYAPVPPDDESTTPPGGSLGSLGLGGSSTLRRPVGEQTTTETGIAGRGTRPSTKRCSGNPPRQTEDPLSPPCVAFFSGNNFGATHTGVTRDEVRIIAYLDGNERDNSPDRYPQCETYYDLAEPPDPNEGSGTSFYLDNIRILQRYFNDRFQTYERFVHFIAYASRCGESSPESRRADAADVYSRIKPFAMVNFTYGDNSEEFDVAMANKGVISFGGNPSSINPERHYHRVRGFVWGLFPSMETQSELYTSYLCKKVLPYRVSFGNPDHQGDPRKYGLLYTNDPGYPNHLHLRWT